MYVYIPGHDSACVFETMPRQNAPQEIQYLYLNFKHICVKPFICQPKCLHYSRNLIPFVLKDTH